MAKFTDFADLKSRVSFAQTVSALKLDLKQSGNQWRGKCPACLKGGDRALVVTEGKGFFCFADGNGGDQIALVAHILNLQVKDAAAELAARTGTVHITSTMNSKTVPESGDGKEGARTFQPLTYLEADHPAVDAIGFSAEICAKLGIGYAGKGIMRGTVAIPIRDETGALLGYIGIQEAKLPPNFTTNIVSFPKTA